MEGGNNLRISLPPDVLYIIETLEAAGYDAYVVGGGVRDSLMGINPHDWDVCTNAKPSIVADMFKHTYLVGAHYGAVKVLLNEVIYDVVTFRTETLYTDGRRPDEVSYIDDIHQDLARRDFTINAIAYHPTKGFIDPHHGMDDIKSKVIQCIGRPADRFTEDPLRVLRAVRFSCSHGFTIDDETWLAMHACAPQIQYKTSINRVNDEVCKMLLTDPYKMLDLLRQLELVNIISGHLEKCIGFEQDNPYHYLDVYEHTREAIRYLHVIEGPNKDLVTRYALMLHDTGKVYSKITGADGIAHYKGHPKVSWSNASDCYPLQVNSSEFIEEVLWLIKYHDYYLLPEKVCVKRLVRKIISQLGKPEVFLKLLDIKEADGAAHVTTYANYRPFDKEVIIALYHEVMAEESCLKLTDLKVNGHDVMGYGFRNKEVGEILYDIWDAVISGVVENDREKLLYLIQFKMPRKERLEMLNNQDNE